MFVGLLNDVPQVSQALLIFLHSFFVPLCLDDLSLPIFPVLVISPVCSGRLLKTALCAPHFTFGTFWLRSCYLVAFFITPRALLILPCVETLFSGFLQVSLLGASCPSLGNPGVGTNRQAQFLES